MKLTREKILECLLLCMNDSAYTSHFPHQFQHQFIEMGYTAVNKSNSNIRMLLETLAKTLEMQLGEYQIVPPKPLTRVQKRAAEKAKKDQEKADKERFKQLEQAWREDVPRAEKELLENAEKAAQNIFNKNQSLKGTRE